MSNTPADVVYKTVLTRVVRGDLELDIALLILDDLDDCLDYPSGERYCECRVIDFATQTLSDLSYIYNRNDNTRLYERADELFLKLAADGDIIGNRLELVHHNC